MLQEDEVVHTAMIFIVIYVLLILLGTLFNTLFGTDLETGFSAAVACIGNVGPGFGAVGSMDNYAALPSAMKLNLTFLMLLGRLEIFGLINSFLSDGGDNHT